MTGPWGAWRAVVGWLSFPGNVWVGGSGLIYEGWAHLPYGDPARHHFLLYSSRELLDAVGWSP